MPGTQRLGREKGREVLDLYTEVKAAVMAL